MINPISTLIIQPYNTFFHTPISKQTLTLTAILRIYWSILFLSDRYILYLDIHDYFSPTTGYLPYSIGKQSVEDPMLSLFSIFPDSDLWLYLIFWMGVLLGVCCLLGIGLHSLKGKVMIMGGLWMNVISYQHHDGMFWDTMDYMLRFWLFFLMLLPIERRCNVYDLWHWILLRWRYDNVDEREKKRREMMLKREEEDEEYSMWPYRLWQLEVTFIYFGCGLGKIEGESWRNGEAMMYVVYSADFYGGMFNPDILFNRYLPLKMMTYMALFVECTCWITIWPNTTRMFTLLIIVLLHLGIEISMNMHIFEFVSILGWLVFLAEPMGRHEIQQRQQQQEGNDVESETTPTSSNKKTTSRRMISNMFIILIITLFWSDSYPATQIYTLCTTLQLAPSWFEPIPRHLGIFQLFLNERVGLEPFGQLTGLWQGPWTPFAPNPYIENNFFEASIYISSSSNNTQQQQQQNETMKKITWTNPRWKNMNWFEKKRWSRVMLYYENLADPEWSEPAWDYLCKKLSIQYGPHVSVVELGYHWEAAPKPKKNSGWMDVVKREDDMRRGWKRLYAIECEVMDEEEGRCLKWEEYCMGCLGVEFEDEESTVGCHDFHKECPVWAEKGECIKNPGFMKEKCAWSCDACDGLDQGDDHAYYYYEDEEEEEENYQRPADPVGNEF